jgi:uncharacterized membrane protein YfcA
VDLTIGLVALFASSLTLFSGFGLGTILMPAFAIFFPIPVAVAATALVHVANNLFKVGLLRRDAAPHIVWRFGLPAVAAAFPGAFLLTGLSGLSQGFAWHWGAHVFTVTPIRLVMGLLILGFSALELFPVLRRIHPGEPWLPLGGALSGFFGGLSGHQGALRAAFLRPLGLAPGAYAGTQAAIAVLVDLARLAAYGFAFFHGNLQGIATSETRGAVVVATLCAFAGAYVGKRLLPSVTVGFVRVLTGILLGLVGGGMVLGVL